MKRLKVLFFLFLLSLSSFANESRWDEDKDQWSKLMLAIYYGHADTYNALINRGVDFNYQTKDYELSALGVAIYKEDYKAVKALVQTRKIKNLSSSLMIAAQFSNVSIIDILIKFGADPNMNSENGHTALMSAVSDGSSDVLISLLKHGAKVNHQRKVDGMTPLMMAAYNEDIQKTEILLEFKADKGLKDLNGKLAIDYVSMISPQPGISKEAKEKLRLLLKLNKKPQLLTPAKPQ